MELTPASAPTVLAALGLPEVLIVLAIVGVPVLIVLAVVLAARRAR
jgi:hypothetical protein